MPGLMEAAAPESFSRRGKCFRSARAPPAPRGSSSRSGGLRAAERDRLAGHFAIAIFAFVEAADRAIDFGDQLALAVAGAELDSPVGLARRAVGEVGLAQRITWSCAMVARDSSTIASFHALSFRRK